MSRGNTKLGGIGNPLDVAAAQPVAAIGIGSNTLSTAKSTIGLAKTTNYSRVNTGTVPAADAGAMGQKSVAPKTASEEKMTTMASKFGAAEMVKAAIGPVGCDQGAHDWEYITNSDQAHKCRRCGLVSGK